MKRILAFFLMNLLLVCSCCFAEEIGNEYRDGNVIVRDIRLKVDFSLIDYLTDDMAGWVWQSSCGAGFPLMTGTPDNRYLTHTYKNKYQKTYGGFCLTDGESWDFSDPDPVLLARNTEDGALGFLKKFTDQEAYNANPCARVLTRDGDYQLDYFYYNPSTEESNDAFFMPKSEEDYKAWLEKLKSECDLFAPVQEAFPSFGEKVLLLSTAESGKRPVLLATMRPIVYETDREYDLAKYDMDHIESTSHTASLGSLGEMFVYSQKDPVWADLRFESKLTQKYRHISGGGCGPCAMANILINLIDLEELPKLMTDNANGIGTLMCTCSANPLYCNTTHLPYHPETPEEYGRYLPVIICDYLTGNNQAGVVSRRMTGTGTKINYIPYVCETLGLECIPVASLEEGMAKLQEDNSEGFLYCTALSYSPFALKGSTHYVAIAGVDDEGYVYVLDSLNREKYSGKGKTVGAAAPGVGMIHISEISLSSLCPEYYIRLKEGTPGRKEVFRGWSPDF